MFSSFETIINCKTTRSELSGPEVYSYCRNSVIACSVLVLFFAFLLGQCYGRERTPLFQTFLCAELTLLFFHGIGPSNHHCEYKTDCTCTYAPRVGCFIPLASFAEGGETCGFSVPAERDMSSTFNIYNHVPFVGHFVRNQVV